ncbi:MAG TPA: UvrD-helicase domain-containing protein, partial [Cyclobacteriaceae bacterium]|nr:UvrD-helicase domain-containing protein [Cyclobacteriaceae bacterium]
GFEVELDLDRVLSEITDMMFLDLDQDPGLLNWLLQFTQARMEEEKGWDVRKEISGLGREIFRESFKGTGIELSAGQAGVHSIMDLKNELAKSKFTIEEKMKDFARKGIEEIENNGFTFADFAYGETGPAGFFYKMLSKQQYEAGARVMQCLDNPDKWITKKSERREDLLHLVSSRLIPLLNESITYFNRKSHQYYSAGELYRFLYTYGLLKTLVDKLQKYRDDHGVILVSDLSLFLKSIIRDCDTPFIYEKAGSFYEHFLIDEFQDTSAVQWNNFSPLIKNSLAQGKFNMVVGDVKQSIYRWRGGDWRILDHLLENDIGKEYITLKNLDANWRSRENIILFNNYFFSAAVSILEEYLKSGNGASGQADDKQPVLLKKAWEDVKQKLPDKKESAKGGFVQIKFIPERPEEGENGTGKFREKVLSELPGLFEFLQDHGFSARDIAIIVRSNHEGREIAGYMLEFMTSPKARNGYKYDVISSESLALEASHSVNTLVNALRLVSDPGDDLARINLVYHYLKLFPAGNNQSWHHSCLTAMKARENFKVLESVLPGEFIERFIEYPGMPVHELISAMLSDLGLGALEGEYPYLMGFQDAVLEFVRKERSDIRAFLDWWDEKGKERSISLPQNQDAASIMTIHKSKGLEFKVVILPFCNWNFDHNTRHDNILWVDAGKTVRGFDSVAPVKYSAKLGKTYYSDEYEEERLLSYIDNLNLMYVAFTRASEALYIFSPESDPSVSNFKMNDAGKLVAGVTKPLANVKDAVHSGFEGQWDPNAMTYRIGDIHPPVKPVQTENESRLDKIISSPWRSRISFRRVAENAFLPGDGVTGSELNIGLVVHDILARVVKHTDIEVEMQRAMIAGEIPVAIADEIRSSLARLMEDPKISDWFSGNWEVMTEVPVIPAPGELNRMDRVMIRNRKAIVLDYKTGQKRNEDIAQIREYMRILNEMEYQDVEGYLLYLSSGELVKA